MVRCEDPVLVEAPSGRSRCVCCGEFIPLGSTRVGMPARHNGLSVTKWVHPPCFARFCVRCDYAPTDRARCQGDGSPIRKGEPRLVLFLESPASGKVVHQKAYKPPNAAPFLRDLCALPGVDVRPDSIAGLDALDTPEHRAWVVAALAGLLPLGGAPAPTRDAAAAPPPPLPALAAPVAALDDALFLSGCTIRVHWPQPRKGRARLRTGVLTLRTAGGGGGGGGGNGNGGGGGGGGGPKYWLSTERKRGGIRERRTSWGKLRTRWYEVLSSPREAPYRWSAAEVAAARERLASGESAESVGRGLGRSAQAVELKVRGACKREAKGGGGGGGGGTPTTPASAEASATRSTSRSQEVEAGAALPNDSDSESCELVD